MTAQVWKSNDSDKSIIHLKFEAQASAYHAGHYVNPAHDVRAKGNLYAKKIPAPFQEHYKSCWHLLITDDVTFRFSDVCQNFIFWMQDN